MLDEHFTGNKEVDSGKHHRWAEIFIRVKPPAKLRVFGKGLSASIYTSRQMGLSVDSARFEVGAGGGVVDSAKGEEA
jgi:hypothetical protein